MNSEIGKSGESRAWDPWGDMQAYLTDSWERSILFLDVMRQRGNQYQEHMAEKVPHVLSFQAGLVMDGRKLPRPVNYGLVRVEPPQGVVTDPKKRPFVIADPRAGHGPGIGGFKADSEIGVALRAGHPCYFIGFTPTPEPGQTVEDVMNAEAAFVEKVGALHPEADGKPVVVGNCQAGWQIMMTAATRPELFGPIIIAGAPLSYWAGVRGQNPMRYTGGMLGGSWLTAMIGDLGHGIFDGAWLVQNFESMNPANTLWGKPYNLYTKVDTEAPRYLGFEKWWGGHVLLNAQEMQYIVDKLFVGNKLASGELATTEGTRIDLREIRSPIIVFCSKGDDITPPQQALGWITDLYRDVNDIRAHGQTIIYSVHESIGHLGIFVSGSVAKKEHDEFASNIDFIDVLPPGLYEAVLVPRGEAGSDEAGLIAGDYLVRFVARSMDDLHKIVSTDPEDETRFAAVERMSEINLGLYRTFMQPWIKAMANQPMAEWMRQMHPQRLGYDLMSDRNPWLALVEDAAEQIRKDRHLAPSDNTFRKAEQAAGSKIENFLQTTHDLRDRLVEDTFLAVYGSPLLQSLVGLKAEEGSPRRRPGDDPDHRAFVRRRMDELRGQVAQGGVLEAWVRALVYIRMSSATADERVFNLLRRMRDERGSKMTISDFKVLLREQFLMVLIAPDEALAALPRLLEGASDEELRTAMTDLRRVLEAAGPLDEQGQQRLAAVEKIFAKPARELASASARASVEAVPAPEEAKPETARPEKVPLHKPAAVKEHRDNGSRATR